MIVEPATLATLRAAMLPMDGTIADHAEEILAAAADAMSPAGPRYLAYVDLTAGSCLLPLAFAAAGARSVVVNDIATRSIVAARALFAGGDVPAGMLDDALAGRLPARAHVPSFRFASDYLPEAACRTFDRLYHLDLPAPQAATLRYLALRHVLRMSAWRTRVLPAAAAARAPARTARRSAAMPSVPSSRRATKRLQSSSRSARSCARSWVSSTRNPSSGSARRSTWRSAR